jgi:hypothetical protein
MSDGQPVDQVYNWCRTGVLIDGPDSADIDSNSKVAPGQGLEP